MLSRYYYAVKIGWGRAIYPKPVYLKIIGNPKYIRIFSMLFAQAIVLKS